MGTDIQGIENINLIEKFDNPTIISLGRITAMKRTIDQVKAFELAKKEIENLKLIIAGYGDDNYFGKLMLYIKNSQFSDDIKYLGKISFQDKIEYMSKSHLISVTSIKEGWGLIVTEANSQGTPAIVYDVDGLRDSVKHNETGLICTKNTPVELSKNIIELLQNKNLYKKLQKNAWQWSKEITFKQCYIDFKKAIKI
jgi:glycosyltransferase involved in cell wall biosynthesis